MEKNYKIRIDNLITLCHIIYDFKEFEQRLLPIISPEYNRDFVFQLWDVSRGKFKLGAKKTKTFYLENKSIIDTINKYSNIPTFINQGYGYHGEPNDSLQFFYQYLKENKNEIYKILSILERLKELGFLEIKFDENLELSNKEYNMDASFRRNFRITYADNIQVIPNYDNEIRYRINSSNYKMELGIILNDFSEYDRNIILNSLLFELNRLPKKIDKETIFEPILKLKEAQEKETDLIKNSINLNVSVSDLDSSLRRTAITILSISGIKNRKELIDVLSAMKENIEELKKLSSVYDSNILEDNPTLTQTILENEKKLYLKRRDSEHIHFD